MARSTGDTDGVENMGTKDEQGVHGWGEHRGTHQEPPSSRPPLVLLLFMWSTWPHLTCSPFSPFSFTWYSPPLFPLTLPFSPVPRTVIVFIFILVEEAEALQGMLHSDAETGGPASSQALSLLGF